MSRNTKEISLIQIRQGNLSELPKALHQAEFGLAKDSNQVFIGNGENNILANRTEFPYQNLEILTEMSDLSGYLKYIYENNIKSVNGIENRSEYKEMLPIVINCSKHNPYIDSPVTFKLNDYEINIPEDSDVNTIIDKINFNVSSTHTYALKLQGTDFITFISFTSQLTIENIDGDFTSIIGFPQDIEISKTSLPSKLISDKLNDILLLSDFGIVSDGTTNVAKSIYNALFEIYKNGDESQFFRKVELQAGKYIFEKDYTENDVNGEYIQIEYPLPLISNMRLSGQGIDRTILYANGYTNSFLNCFNKNLIISNENNYYNYDLPRNIVIEDMTIDASTIKSCILSGISNVTFNRVKFIGADYSTLLTISSISESYKCKNITFNECIFENAKFGIVVEKNASNLVIKNCLFKNIGEQAIVFGSTEETIQTIVNSTVDNCIFENCCYMKTGSSVIKCFSNTKYIHVTNNHFDEIIYKRQSNTPYESLSEYNYCDTYDPNTSTKKFLRFNGTQPVWDNAGGIYDDNLDPNISFKTVNNNMEIRSKVEGDTILFNNPTGNIVLGYPLDGSSNSSGDLIINKDLNLIGNSITSNDNIIFKMNTDKVLKLDTSKNTTKYEYLIGNDGNNIPNVAYVKNIAKHSILKPIDYKVLDLMEGELIPLVLFDSNVYGYDMHITKISIDVTKPFYSMNKENAISYNVGLKFEKGDLVTDGTNYYSVIKAHQVEDGDSVENNEYLVKVELSDKPFAKYIDLIGYATNGQLYDISNIFKPAFLTNGNSFISGVDLQNNDKHGLTNCRKYVYGESYSNGTFIEFNNIIFKTNYKDGSVSKLLTKEGLYNPDYAERMYVEGHNYMFDLEKELYNMTKNQIDTNNTLLNWSNGKLYLRLLDENRNPLNDVTKEQFNPGGEVVVRIEMIKHDEIIIPEVETYTVSVLTNVDSPKIKLTYDGQTYETNTIETSFGSEVTYEVSKDGYETKTGSIKVYKDEMVYVYLDPKMVTLTVNTQPSDSNIELRAGGYEQVDNTITVPNGTNVDIIISKEGYVDYNQVITMTKDETLDIILEKEMYTLTIIADPKDANIELRAEGYNQVYNTITVPNGTNVDIFVSKEGYNSYETNYMVTKDETMNVVLEKYMITLTVNVYPEEATLELTSDGYTQEGNSITVPANHPINIYAYYDSFIPHQSTEIYTESTTLDIYLEQDAQYDENGTTDGVY